MEIAALLKEEMEKSNKYPKENFGAKVGSDWPDFVRSMIDSKEFCIQLSIKFMLSTLLADQVIKEAGDPDKMTPGQMARNPIVYETPLEFLYWGIRIGRRLAEVDQLKELAEAK